MGSDKTEPPLEAEAARQRTLEFSRKHLRWNYAAFAIESGVYLGGTAFIAPETILPNVVKELGGSEILIALMPSLTLIGFMLPQLLVAHRIERLRSLKRWVQIASLPQRSAFLVAGLMLIFAAEDYPKLTLTAVVLAPLISGLAGGLNVAAWMEFVSRAIPARRRGSLVATRNLVGTCIGFFAGREVVKPILDTYEPTLGYGLLHVIAFGFLMLSLAILSLTKEPPKPGRKEPSAANLRQSLGVARRLTRTDPRLRLFAWSRFWGTAFFILPPFLSIHAREVTGRGPEFLGELIAAGMVGAVAGNLLGGYLTDKSGGRAVFAISKVLTILYALGAVWNAQEWGFYAIFFAMGAGWNMQMVGNSTMTVEIAPADNRITFLSLMSAISLPGMLLAAGIAAGIQRWVGEIYPAALVCALATGMSLYCLLRIPEPRHQVSD